MIVLLQYLMLNRTQLVNILSFFHGIDNILRNIFFNVYFQQKIDDRENKEH